MTRKTKRPVPKQRTHKEIAATLDRLDRLAPIVGAGFIVFWIIWALALIGSVVYVFFG
jgi:heme O synthase-like polyprenyltransferase